MPDYWVYLLANKPRSTLYVGVTNDLVRRVYEHREGLVKGFTARYGTGCSFISSAMIPRTLRYSVRKTSSIGPEFGNSG